MGGFVMEVEYTDLVGGVGIPGNGKGVRIGRTTDRAEANPLWTRTIH
jgi:hypothetical protein